MKSGVFPFTRNSSQEEPMVFSLLYTQIVAQCMNNNPWTPHVDKSCMLQLLIRSRWTNYKVIVGDITLEVAKILSSFTG